MKINICIIQPRSHIHALGFIDQARYMRFHFKRLGAEVSVSKNRLLHGAVNFVLGAHLGFDLNADGRYACIIVNLEQLGPKGALLRPEYIELIKTSPSIDYDPKNIEIYNSTGRAGPVMEILYAPYLTPAEKIPLEERPIDLLFFGSLNPRRVEIIQQIEALGVDVATFDHPIYGPERDEFIKLSKAVLNLPFYETSRFEQSRAFQCLSLGTPLISEFRNELVIPPGYQGCVTWFQEDNLTSFFRSHFRSKQFFEEAQCQLETFKKSDPTHSFTEILAFAAEIHSEFNTRGSAPKLPARLNVVAGSEYRAGWINIGPRREDEPDAALNFNNELLLPLALRSETLGELTLTEASIELIEASKESLDPISLANFMANCLKLLKSDGKLTVEISIESFRSKSSNFELPRTDAEFLWNHFTNEFWKMNWFEHRFKTLRYFFLDQSRRLCGLEKAVTASITFEKVETTLQERMQARIFQQDLRLPPDQATVL